MKCNCARCKEVSRFLANAHRGGASGQHIVDGGLCEHLPVLDMEDSEELGAVLAISFARTKVPQTPTSTLGMLKALLDTAIGNAVHRAAAALPNGRVLPLESDIDLLDFRSALEDGLEQRAWTPHPEPGFVLKGWVGRDLKKGERFAVQLTLPR